MKLIDVTPFTLEPIKRVARGDSSNVSTLRMSAHAGTHIDAGDFAPHDLSEDVRVLIKTGNSRFWGSPDFQTDYVGVTESGARHLVEHGTKVVGVDYLSVEEFKKPGAPAHRLLLGAGTIVIEGLNLRDVDPGIYDMDCLPLRVVGSDGAPARVVLRKG